MWKNVVEGLAQYPLAVVLDASRCLRLTSVFGRYDDCQECQARCPRQALSLAADSVVMELDPTRCDGCGLCVGTCPGDALALRDETAEMLRAWDSVEVGAVVRMTCIAVPGGPEGPGRRVPCLGALDWAEVLIYLLRGASGVELTSSGCESCPRGAAAADPIAALIKRVSDVADLARCGSVRLVSNSAKPHTNHQVSRRRLWGFLRPHSPGHDSATNVAPLRVGSPEVSGARRKWLRAELVRHLSVLKDERLETSHQQLEGLEVDLNGVGGRPWVDPERCIACPLCSASCPTAALELSAGNKLILKPHLCIGCERCVESCREGAMHLASYVDLADWTTGERILATGRVVGCERCGETALLPLIGLCASCYRQHGALSKL